MKVHILEALAHIGDPSSIPFLLDILKEPFQVLRVCRSICFNPMFISLEMDMDWQAEFQDVQKHLQKERSTLVDLRLPPYQPFASDFLKLDPDLLVTRRFFYWIPAKGNPSNLHVIEPMSSPKFQEKQKVFEVARTSGAA